MTVQANLKKTGYMWKKIEDQYIIIKEDAVAIEVAESLPELSDIILEYNHYRLKGNISRKRQILNQIAFVLEPIRNDLDSVCKKEISDFFFMVNNMNIRHNNCDPKVPGKYKAAFALLSDTEQEEWYDMAYSQALTIMVRKDQVIRSKKIDAFKNRIENNRVL